MQTHRFRLGVRGEEQSPLYLDQVTREESRVGPAGVCPGMSYIQTMVHHIHPLFKKKSPAGVRWVEQYLQV